MASEGRGPFYPGASKHFWQIWTKSSSFFLKSPPKELLGNGLSPVGKGFSRIIKSKIWFFSLKFPFWGGNRTFSQRSRVRMYRIGARRRKSFFFSLLLLFLRLRRGQFSFSCSFFLFKGKGGREGVRRRL